MNKDPTIYVRHCTSSPIVNIIIFPHCSLFVVWCSTIIARASCVWLCSIFSVWHTHSAAQTVTARIALSRWERQNVNDEHRTVNAVCVVCRSDGVERVVDLYLGHARSFTSPSARAQQAERHCTEWAHIFRHFWCRCCCSVRVGVTQRLCVTRCGLL